MCFLKKITSLFVVSFFICVYSLQEANAIRIVAIVGDKAITDYDIDNFGKILCKIDTKVKCNSIENQQMSIMTIVETYLKLEHYKQSRIDLSQFSNDFKKYKGNMIESFKLKQNDITEQFNDYLFTEFVWNIMLSSQLKNKQITDKEIQNYAIEKKIKIDENNKIMIKNQIMQNEYNKQSMKMINELKKIYFVDIKG